MLFIEKSASYRAIQNGVQMAEFLLLRQQTSGLTAWIVEAKSSSPRPETKPNFEEFIEEIRTKLTNGFLLSVAARLGRHPATASELPDDFKTLDVQTLGFRFVLVINGHEEEWLVPIKDALTQALKPLVKTWGLSPHLWPY